MLGSEEVNGKADFVVSREINSRGGLPIIRFSKIALERLHQSEILISY
jgi:hypothetical protein